MTLHAIMFWLTAIGSVLAFTAIGAIVNRYILVSRHQVTHIPSAHITNRNSTKTTASENFLK